jgi:hypothetical protein
MNNSETIVRNKNNTPIGVCKEFPDRINAVHYRKGYVGCYTKGVDVTTDVQGKIYCYGNGCTALILDADRGL